MIKLLLNVDNVVSMGVEWVRLGMHEDFNAETSSLKTEEL
jgi:hypothetical protein